MVGGKGIETAVKAAEKLGFSLKIAGEQAGYSNIDKYLETKNVELLGRVSDNELPKFYAEAKGFLALERDVDFGMTPLEANAAGTPVIALNSGGFRETIIDGVTGFLINDTKVSTIKKAINKLDKTKWERSVLQGNAKRFSKDRFKKEIRQFIESRIR